MKSKELRAKRVKLISDARAFYNALKGAPSAEEDARFEAMMAEAEALKGEIDKLERADEAFAATMETLRSTAAGAGADIDQIRGQVAVADGAFRAWARGQALNEEQRGIFQRSYETPNAEGMGGWRLGPAPRPQNALGVTPDTAGGYTVPQGFYGQLIDAQLAYGGMIEASFVFDTTTGNSLPVPTDNDTSNKGQILGENVQVPQGDIAFGAVTFNAYTYSSKLVLVSNQLLQDTAFNLDAWLSGKLGVRIARITNDHFTFGTGASQPTGATIAATLGYTAGGSTSSGSTTAISFDDLIELEHSVDPAYRKGASFMFADSTLKSIKKLKDGLGRPLWLPGLAVKEPDTINQYAYNINQSMAAMAASAKSVLFGDFKNYFIRRVAGVQILRLTERYADFNQVGFLAFQRWDGNMVDAGTHPVKYLQNSAS
jgi:HK97 family phage major capsid protein